MAKWVKSLIRISTFEVETLQKRLAEVGVRRTHAEMKIATLDAELQLEIARASEDILITQHMPAYKAGWAMRRQQAVSDLELVAHEEAGIRDELTGAFEELKKFEHVAEVTRLSRVAADLKRENAAMDEAALRFKKAG
ncbi:flagellar export protein FliJ [Asticcacaulis sp. BYS171W]|uniref:Flagellar export protein FliJ n=1 Tax=Asticcacaulis aquaticus TaxID=2984212 RepID=A0ABT5HSZ7_9CAUL|nr:flagellar export protein FliJ [Asticcacaulis aquaticus]MDC7683188.1 flagellar export protein FliJ [Asticcacaulis aquaticus]